MFAKGLAESFQPYQKAGSIFNLTKPKKRIRKALSLLFLKHLAWTGQRIDLYILCERSHTVGKSLLLCPKRSGTVEREPETDAFPKELEYKNDKLYIILRGHLYIENELDALLEGFLPNPDVLELHRESFRRKIFLALALNLIEQNHFAALRDFNEFRNKYAHRLKYHISHQEIIEFKNSLSKINGLEVFAEEIPLGDKSNSVTDLKLIIVGLLAILKTRASGIKKCENPVFGE